MFTKWSTENLSTHKLRLKAGLIAVLALIMVITGGCSLLPKEQEEEILPEITPPRLSQKPEYTVKTDTIETRIRSVGKVMSMKEEALFFTLEGQHRIKDIYVQTGDQVAAGELIAELDVTDLTNQLRSRQLQFRSDEIAMKNTLRRQHEMSAEDFEQAKIEFEKKRTELVELQEQINRAKLYAPFDGTVVSVTAARGDQIQAYTDVMVVADLNQLTVAAQLNKDDLSKISVGMEVTVDINAVGQHKGKVKQLPVENANQNNNNYPPYYPGYPGGNQQNQRDTIDKYLVVELDEFPAEANRGTPLSVTIVTQRKENVVVIPPSTLRTYGGRTYVQVVESDGSKREVDVEVGQQTSTQVEIVKGLEPGQKVVGR